MRSSPPAAGGTTHRHRVPPRDVPAERRQGSCQYPKAAPSGRPSSRPVRLAVLSIAFALVAALGVANPSPTSAAGMKVVIIVGPVGSSTANYIYNAKKYAAQARSYGATVVEIYSPNATWARVKAAAQGAKVLIYLGHGNGYPSPYGAFSQYTKDGFGLNRTAGAGNSQHEVLRRVLHPHVHQARAQRRRDPQPAVLRLGQLRVGRAEPDKLASRSSASTTTAPASSVPERGPSSPTGSRAPRTSCTGSSGRAARSARSSRAPRTGTAPTTSSSSRVRTPQFRAWLAPYAPNRYYRSVIGNLSLSAATIRGS